MGEKKSSPSMYAWLEEAKAHESAEKIGMYLTHNGVVRKSAKAKVRLGEADTKDVVGMWFSYDEEKVAKAVQETYEDVLEGCEGFFKYLKEQGEI